MIDTLLQRGRIAISVLRHEGPKGVLRRIRAARERVSSYDTWITLNDELSAADVARIRHHVTKLAGPLISVVLPVYNTPPELLQRAIDSIRDQLYERWELCVADDGSTAPDVRRTLDHYAQLDRRIKVCYRSANGHISAASNSALELATGDYVALFDHDDELPPHALYMVAEAISRRPDADIVYSDEDKLDADGRRFEPYFKPDWNEGLFYSHNLISHLGVYRTALVRDVGGFREGYEGSQDYDLALRCLERSDPHRVVHIPFVLYHWRAIPGSTASGPEHKDYAHTAALRALNDHFRRRGHNGEVVEGMTRGVSRARFLLPTPPPLVSVIVPTRDSVDLLSKCVEGLLEDTSYPYLEVLIIDNQSREPRTLSFLERAARDPRVRVIRYDAPFNYSAMNNAAVRQSRGEVICLLNNDIEVLTADWLEEMVGHALRPEIGAVGAKLLYPDDTVQHAGVVLGIGGVAGHVHRRFAARHPGFCGRAIIGQELSAVTGACLVVRRAVYEEVGGLDETHLSVAHNDVDFCLRLRKAGYRNYWTPFAVLRHHESKSRGYEDSFAKQARFWTEIAYMRRTWGDWLDADPAYNPNLTLTSEDCGLSFRPRVFRPWTEASHQPTAAATIAPGSLTVAVVVNYQTPESTIRTVRSLQRSHVPPGAIVVVDNGSDDNSVGRLDRDLSGIRLVTADHNRGFSAGSNRGIQEALTLGADRVLLVNSDIEVQPDTIEELERALGADPRLGVVGPVIISRSDPNRVESIGIRYSMLTGRMRHYGSGEQRSRVAEFDRREVDGIAGCIMLIRREVLERVGMFAEEFFFGFEDLDLCLRARAAGSLTASVGKAVAWHDGSSTGRRSAGRAYFGARNHLLLARRAATSTAVPARAARAAAIVAFNVAHALLTSEIPRGSGLKGVFDGVRDHLKARYGPGPYDLPDFRRTAAP